MTISLFYHIIIPQLPVRSQMNQQEQKRPTYHIGSMMAHKTKNQRKSDDIIIDLEVNDPLVNKIVIDGDEYCYPSLESIDDWMIDSI